DNGKMTLDNSGVLLQVESTAFSGGAGDIINLTAGTNAIIGGAGNDQITATTGRNTVLGDDGLATFYPNGDLQHIESINLGNGGNDTISLQDGTNAVIAGAGADSVTATNGFNLILGDEGEADLYTDGSVDLIRTVNSGTGGSDTIQLGNGINLVIAGAGNDTVTAGLGQAAILGDEGQRIVTRNGSGNPVGLVIETLNDTVGGHDSITSSAAMTFVFGGAGADSITGTAVSGNPVPRLIALGDGGHLDDSDPVSGEIHINTKSPDTGGIDTITLVGENDVIFGGDAGDTINAGEGHNFIVGDHGQATFGSTLNLLRVTSTDVSSGGDDHIQSGAGNDTVVAGFGSDTVLAGNGNNIVVGDHADAVIDASGILRSITTTSSGVGSGDVISTGSGRDIIVGGAGGDDVTAGEGNNIVIGDNGTATFDVTGTLRDIVSQDDGIGGADTVSAGSGNDVVLGGTTGDRITLVGGSNVVLGDGGHATFDAAGQLRSINTLSPGFGGDDVISTGNGDDVVLGGSGADSILAANGRNTLFGDNGVASFSGTGTLVDVYSTNVTAGSNDTITAGTGNDLVIGGAASDSINAGTGNNIITGDNGYGTFDAAGRIMMLMTLSSSTGGQDNVTTGNGNDLILGGASGDTINSGDGGNLVLGDNGKAFFDANAQWLDVFSLDP
ncbi:MAG: hypothetical protein KDA96_25640, partial [Planctomycetaceae bacterium]|nr:hypothetical protein [Planctomycetaceae bacterium]